MRRILGVSAQFSSGQGTSGHADVGHPSSGRPIPAQSTSGLAAPVAAADILLAQQAIKKMLPEIEAAPSKGKAPADAGLSQLYFRNINEPVRKQ